MAVLRIKTLHRGDGVAVLLVGHIVIAGRDRAIFAVGDGFYPGRGDTLRDEVVAGGGGALVAQGQVVGLGTALISIAGDKHVDGGVFIQPGGLAGEGGSGVGAEIGFVEGEEDAVTDVGAKVLFGG